MSLPQLAPGVRRPSPELLVGGSPMRVMRLSSAGTAALDAVLSGRDVPAAAVIERRLVDAGLLLRPPGAPRLDDVTVVVPARATDDEVRRTLGSLPVGVPVVVVDDGSEPPLRAGVRVHPSRGPAAARNLGASRALTGIVAFVDTAVQLPPGALERLSGHFADPRVVAVAPRVRSDPAPGAAGVLEQALCALDQGAVPGEVRPGAAVSYVPSTVLLVRRAALLAVGGFDEELHVGEDVDLVWRLSAAGVVRYDPEVVARHAPRSSLRAALRRRYDYGTSAGLLDARHPRQLRHLRLSWWTALPWAAALAHPVAAAVAPAAVVATAPRRLPTLPSEEARRVTWTAQWSAFGASGRYALRPAAPLTAALLLSSSRARRLAPLLATAYAAGSWSRLNGRPVGELPARLVLHLLDDVAYTAGVWRGAALTGRWRVLLPGRPYAVADPVDGSSAS